nr:hypothetical protein CFP56_59554 [Quercus suber]
MPWSTTLIFENSFLMLPTTFDSDKLLRVSQAAIGIFAVAILTAGFSLTALICFAVRNRSFQLDSVFIPAASSCALGLLTVFYDFLISSRYVWNTPALLVTIAAAISTIIYGCLSFWMRWQTSHPSQPRETRPPHVQTTPLARHSSVNSSASLWQDPVYYENYVRNMYPTSARPSPQPQPSMPYGNGLSSPDHHQSIAQYSGAPGAVYDPSSITEEEMQRQQMLMLLLQPNTTPGLPNAAPNTYNIDWPGNGPDHDDFTTPSALRRAPTEALSSVPTTPRPGVVRQLTNDLLTHPWDGVWRGPGPPPPAAGREERRRQIEQGR